MLLGPGERSFPLLDPACGQLPGAGFSRPSEESFLFKKLQVKADPDFSSGDFVQQEPASCRAFAFLLCSNFCHWNFSTTQEVWGINIT